MEAFFFFNEFTFHCHLDGCPSISLLSTELRFPGVSTILCDYEVQSQANTIFFTLFFVSTSKQVLEAFFRRALAWEKRAGGEEQEEGLYAISLSEEREGVYFYKNGREIGVMLEGNPGNFPSQKIRSIIPGLKGFALVVIHLDKVS